MRMPRPDVALIPLRRIEIPEDLARQVIDEDKIDTLADTIKRCDTVFELIVVDKDNQLVAGKRKLLAGQKLGWTSAWCIRLPDGVDPDIVEMASHTTGVPLSGTEFTRKANILRGKGYSLREIGRATNKSHVYVMKALSLYDDMELRALVEKDKIAFTTGLALTRAKPWVRRAAINSVIRGTRVSINDVLVKLRRLVIGNKVLPEHTEVAIPDTAGMACLSVKLYYDPERPDLLALCPAVINEVAWRTLIVPAILGVKRKRQLQTAASA